MTTDARLAEITEFGTAAGWSAANHADAYGGTVGFNACLLIVRYPDEIERSYWVAGFDEGACRFEAGQEVDGSPRQDNEGDTA